jgi:putative flavoprotein involved in K+ transport
MIGVREPERVQTVVIGAGQAGLSVGYHLARRGLSFVILDGNERIGDTWRRRWDSLRLFTPARFDGLAGMPFPVPTHRFPTKDEMADYLETYAARFDLPVRTGVKVDRLSKEGERFVVAAGDLRFEADNVVVAMANYQRPRVPAFATDLDPGIVQFHSIDYRNPSQLREGGVLIVGAGNSGAEIAMEVARSHRTWMSGRDTGHVPFRIEGAAARLLLVRLVLRFLFHRVLTVKTPMGRKMRPKVLTHGGPLIRVKPKDLAAAGVERVPRTAGVRDGRPVLEDGRVLDVANVIWCTGFHPGFSWIDLPVFGEREPLHERGVVPTVPGLYFVGLDFLYALSSTMIHGVGRDADRVAGAIAARARATRSADARRLVLQPARPAA